MKHWFLLVLLLCTLRASAQQSSSTYKGGSVITRDTTTYTFNNQSRYINKTREILAIGAPLIVAGVVVRPYREKFQDLRHSYTHKESTTFDNYLQYSPAALMLGLKTFGVEGRSSWGRMLVSAGLATGIVSLTVDVAKKAANEKRPDSNASNSLPSGHTATAFMAASLLHKEYGGVSRWYSIAGYTAATATGILRVRNDRHWISDVLVGAGIGVISTELGYLIADIFFKDRHINKELDPYENPSWYSLERPSSIGLYMGITTTLNNISTPDTESIKILTGCNAGFEGAYFLGQNVGIGGRLTIASSQVRVDGVIQDRSMDVVSGGVGGYFAKPISRYFRVGAKVIGGVNYYYDTMICDEFNITEGARPSLSVGASFEYLSSQHYSLKAFCDYDVSRLDAMPNTNAHRSVVYGFVGSYLF